MRPLVWIVTAGLLPLAAGATLGADNMEPKGKKVEFKVHSGYCERAEHARAEQLKAQKEKTLGNVSFLAFTDQDSFDKAFGKTPDKEDLNTFLPNGEAKGKKPNLLPKDAFDKKTVVATTVRGANVSTYKVVKVTADGETLYVQYEESSSFAGNNRVWSSPLILSVDKGSYKSVVFILGNKKYGSAKIEQDKDKDKEKGKEK
jgi:hypothetical protein